MFKFIANTYINSADQFKQLKAGETELGVRVKKVADFKYDNVKAVYSRIAKAAAPFKLTADLAGSITEAGVYRLELYVRLANGSANSYYSNDFVFKGKPFYVEFEVKGTAQNLTVNGKPIAEGIQEIAKKYITMVYENELLEVTGTGTKLTIAGTDEYQMLTTANLQKYTDACGDDCAVSGFETVADLLTTGTYVANEEGFGTYRQAQKDLRLPTAANTRWTKIVPDDYPIPGALYDQVIIYYCVNRGIMGGDAVGEITTSLTEHVFYIKSNKNGAEETPALGDLATAFTALFAGKGSGTTKIAVVSALENLEDGAIKEGASAIDATTVDIPTEVPVTPV